jgi:aspartyl protease family protein
MDDPYESSGGGGGALGWALRQVAIWGGLGLLLYAGVANRTWFQGSQPPQRPAIQTAVGQQIQPASPNSLVYHADPRGHFWVEGIVNGAPVRFMVDTGASFVALTMADAAAAGIGRGNLAFNLAVATANGQTRAAPVKLREVRVGQLSLDDVPALVQENLGISLLGMSFLKRLDGFEIHEGSLTINWN